MCQLQALSSKQRPPSPRRTYRVPRVSVCSSCIFSPGLRRGGTGREEEVGDGGGCGAGDTGAPAASSPLLSTCIHLEISTIVKKKEFTKWIEAIPLTQLIHTDNGGLGSSHTSGQCPKTKCTPRHAVGTATHSSHTSTLELPCAMNRYVHTTTGQESSATPSETAGKTRSRRDRACPGLQSSELA